MRYNELTTVNDLRTNYMGVSGTTDDALLLTFIKTATDWIDKATRRSFIPSIETRYYNALTDIDGNNLVLDADLLDGLTVTNGDATTIGTSSRTYQPRNRTPYDYIRILPSSSLVWSFNTTTNDADDAITVNGVWGYHEDYGNAWETLTTTAANATNTATSITLTAALGNGGEIWKIGTELLYLTSRSTTTATVVRGVNGSTAAASVSGATIYRWVPDVGIAHVCKLGAYGLLKLRDNPEGTNIVVDGVQFATLKDVDKYIKQQVESLNLVRQ